MALKGTIEDFGVADIFQLISQQAKDGVLVLDNDVDRVRIYFKEGSIVRAENATRPTQMLLGALMRRAEVLNEEQVEEALREQRRTLRRFGAIVTELGYATQPIVTEFATLQMTETIYSLFDWTTGTYEFEAQDVEPSPEGIAPIRAESVVMDGIRMMDEWPSIRAKIPSYAWTLERVRALPPESTQLSQDMYSQDMEFGGASAMKRSSTPRGFEDIGPSERVIYRLIEKGRTIQKVIDLSRLGEFEACRAASVLVGHGYARRIAPPTERSTDLADDRGAPQAIDPRAVVATLGRIAMSAVSTCVGILLVAGWWIDPSAGQRSGLRFRGDIVETRLADAEIRVVRRALELHKLETGSYPNSLEDLVASGLLRERDIRFPFESPYHYRVDGDGVHLLPPIR